MARNVGRFVISVASNSKDLITDLRTGTKEVDNFGEAWNNVGNVIAGVGAAIAGFAISDQIFDSLERFNDLADFSEVAGDSIQNIQGLELAGARIGIDEDSIRGTLLDFNERLGEQLVLGTGPLIDVLDVLDLDANELFQLAPVERLLKFGDAVEQVGDQSKQLLLLRELTGDADQFLRLFRDGGGDVRDALEFLSRNGIGFDAADLRALRESRIEWANLGFVIDFAITKIGVSLAPAGGRLARFLVDNSDKLVRFTEIISDFAETSVDFLDRFITTLENLDPALTRNIVRVASFTAGFVAFVAVAPRVLRAIAGIVRSIRNFTSASVVAQSVINPAAAAKAILGFTAGLAAANFIDEQFFSTIDEDFEEMIETTDRATKSVGNLDARAAAFLSRFSKTTAFDTFRKDLTELRTLQAFGALSDSEFINASQAIEGNYRKALESILQIRNLLRNPAILRNRGSVEFKLTEQARSRGNLIVRDRLAADRNKVLDSIRDLLEEIRDQRRNAANANDPNKVTLTPVEFPPIA